MAGLADLARIVPKDHRMGEVAPMWIIVCESFHGAVGPIASEALARELAELASEASGCSYRAIRLGGSARQPSGHGPRI